MFRDNPAGTPPYKVQRIIASQEIPIDGMGRFRRTQLVETDMKYPLLRVEEIVLREGHAGDESILQRTAMVASHMIVQPVVGKENAFLTWASRHGLAAKSKGRATPIYLLEARARTPEDLTACLETARLARDVIEIAEPDYIVQALRTPNDPSFGTLWGLHNVGQTGGADDADIDAPEAWDAAPPTAAGSVVVGVIDTGIDLTHPELAANIWSNPDEIPGNGIDDDGNGYVDDTCGWDFANDDNDPTDDHFHGTHVAGTIGAAGDNALGMSGIVWNARLMALKFLSGSGGGATSDAVEAIDYATANGARLTNNSWGGGGYSAALGAAIGRAQTAGVLFVAAAGNNGSDNDAEPSYPASFDDDIVLAVAATDHQDQLASFSNTGQISVDIAAPGVGIFSTFPTHLTQEMTTRGLPVSYGAISGTSMAAPHVSGTAALIWSRFPTLTAAQVKARLLIRSERLDHLADSVLSGGRLNARLAVADTPDPPVDLAVSGIALDAGGDGQINAGETFALTLELLNAGGQVAHDVTIQATPLSAGVSISGNDTVGVDSILPLSRGKTTVPLFINAPTDVPDGTRITVRLTARWTGGEAVRDWTGMVVRTAPQAKTELTFLPGEPVADPVRERVYLLDQTNCRILAVDTSTGTIATWAGIAGGTTITRPNDITSLKTGMIALAHDGSCLWVALTSSKRLQKFSLPGLVPQQVLDVDFEPVSVVLAANGRLFASTTNSGPLREINPSTGAVTLVYRNGELTWKEGFYMHCLLRTNGAGTRLFASETGLRVDGGPGYVYEFDTTGAADTPPPQIARYPYWMGYMRDFVYDAEHARIYTVNSWSNGIQVTGTNPSDSFGEIWDFGSRAGSAVCMPPGASFVYGATEDPSKGEVSRFDPDSRTRIERIEVGGDGGHIPPRGLAVTSGGSRFYISVVWTGTTYLGINGYKYRAGLIGHDTLDFSNLPPPEATPPLLSLSGVDLSESSGDGVASPGETVQLLPTFYNFGGLTATGVTVTCDTTNAYVTVSSPPQRTISDIPAFDTIAPEVPFELTLSPDTPNDTVVEARFSVAWNGPTGANTRAFTWRFVVRRFLPFAFGGNQTGLGATLADPTRNIVYLLDWGNRRVIAFDTGQGVATAECPLAGAAQQVTGFCAGFGSMALSPDGSRLYITLLNSSKIQVVRLPDLVTEAVFDGTTNAFGIAADAQGRLHTVPTTGGNITMYSATTGQSLGSYGELASGQPRYIRGNPSGTRIMSKVYRSLQQWDVSSTPVMELPITAGVQSSVDDFEWDEPRQRLYATVGGKFYAIDPSGNATNWTPSSAVVSVAMQPQSNHVWTSAQATPVLSTVQCFDTTTGSLLASADITSGTWASVIGNLAVTRNGRALLVQRKTAQLAIPNIDGYVYRLCLVGGTFVDTNVARSANNILSMVSCSMTEATVGDGFATPNETMLITPTIKNLSLATADGVTLRLVTRSIYAKVLSGGPTTAAAIASYETLTPSSPFQVRVVSTAPDGQELRVAIVASRPGVPDQEFEYCFSAFKSTTPYSTLLPFVPGEIAADPLRNCVYIVDSTNARILAFDTQTNSFVAAAPLANDVVSGTFPSVSADGQTLQVASSGSNRIQTFSLPTLTQQDIVDVNFPVHCVIRGMDGLLYGTYSGNEYYASVRQLDPLSGEVLAKLSLQTGSNYSLLRTAGDRRSFVVFTPGTGGTGGSSVPRWDLTSQPPVVVDLPAARLSPKEVLVDETYRRYYHTSGNFGQVSVIELDGGVSNIIWVPPVSETATYTTGGLAMPDGGIYVYSSSATRIVRYRRADGQPCGCITIPSTDGSNPIVNRGLAVTPNERILYIRRSGTSTYQYYLGMIGGGAPNVTVPAPGINIYAGPSLACVTDTAVALNTTVLQPANATGATFRWSVSEGPGTVVFGDPTAAATQASFPSPGRYVLEVLTTLNGATATDQVVATVAAPLPEVSVVASREFASRYGPAQGEFTFARTGVDLTKPLVVGFTATGTAVQGTDYLPLGSNITIAAGAAGATLPVAIPANASFTGSRELLLTVSSNASYRTGGSDRATVTLLDGSFASWKRMHFSYRRAGSDAADADPDMDARSNLLEYGFGTNPNLPDSGPGPVPTLVNNASGRHLALTYSIPAGSTARYTVETADAPGTWITGPEEVEEIARVINPDGTVTVTTIRKRAIDDHAKGFLRVRVEPAP